MKRVDRIHFQKFMGEIDGEDMWATERIFPIAEDNEAKNFLAEMSDYHSGNKYRLQVKNEYVLPNGFGVGRTLSHAMRAVV